MTTASELLAAKCILLDFDGPVAALMPPPVNAQAADRVRSALDGLPLPPDIATTTDHLGLLRFTAEHHPSRVRDVEAKCTAAEVDAARTCQPSVHAARLFSFAKTRGLPVGVVSNNSDQAVLAFLDRQGWRTLVDAVACRTPDTVAWMKPKPQLLHLAADAMGVDITRGVFIGDAVSDVIAGKSAGVPIVGLAKDANRRAELQEAGADAVVRLSDPEAWLPF